MNTASKTAEYSDNPSKTSYMSMGMIALAITIVATASLWYRWFKRTNASTRLKFQLTRIKAKQSRMEAGFRLLEPNAREPFTKPMWSYTLRIASCGLLIDEVPVESSGLGDEIQRLEDEMKVTSLEIAHSLLAKPQEGGSGL